MKEIVNKFFILILGVILIILFSVYSYSFIITPFKDNDLSIDLGILILKDGFVRFLWIILEIVIFLFLINILWKKINRLKQNNKNKSLKNFRINSINETYSVKDFMIKDGYTSVHKTVRANSQNFLYVTFIKENNEANNIYLSSKISSSYYVGQEINKGFFDNLFIEISNDNVKLIGKY